MEEAGVKGCQIGSISLSRPTLGADSQPYSITACDHSPFPKGKGITPFPKSDPGTTAYEKAFALEKNSICHTRLNLGLKISHLFSSVA